ncbi:hypothetical protein ACTXT7_013685 [Hymenolepis weldensis]
MATPLFVGPVFSFLLVRGVRFGYLEENTAFVFDFKARFPFSLLSTVSTLDTDFGMPLSFLPLLSARVCSLPNATRSRESAVTSIKKPKMPNTRTSSVQKLSPIHSASSHRDTKSRTRYSDFNPDRLLNKSCLNGRSPEMEDICNSTFDLGDILNPEISTKSRHDSGDNEDFSVSHPKPSSESNFQRSKIYRTVSPRKVSLNYIKNKPILHNMPPDTIEHEEIFQNEQQCHKYLEDQAYVLDQTESPLPIKTIIKPSFLSKCMQSLKQTSLMSSYDARNSKLENNLGNHIALQNEIDYDHVDHIGNREEISDVFSKFGKVNRRRMAAQQSGILVRAVNVSARREPVAGRQTSQTRISSKTLHCHECGAKYPTTSARFCPECGVKKMAI